MGFAPANIPRDPETGLTIGQRAFCEAYVSGGGNGARAARAAFASLARGSAEAASERGRQLLRLPAVQACIAELRAQRGCLMKHEAETIAEIETLALMAFDERESDVFRLLALRAAARHMLTLREGRRRLDGSMPSIVVRVSIEDPAPTPSASGSGD